MKDHLINLFLKCLVSRETFCEMNVLFGYGISGADSDAVSLPCRQRKIIAVNFLPLNGKKDSETGQWKFILDNDSPLLHLKDGFSPETEVIYVGSLKTDVDVSEQDEVSRTLDFGSFLFPVL